MDRDNSALTCQERYLCSPRDRGLGARVCGGLLPNALPSFLLARLSCRQGKFHPTRDPLRSNTLLFWCLASRVLVLGFRSFQFGFLFAHFRLLCIDLKKTRSLAAENSWCLLLSLWESPCFFRTFSVWNVDGCRAVPLHGWHDCRREFSRPHSLLD